MKDGLNLHLEPSEKMMLADLVQSETWQVVTKVSDAMYGNCLQSLLSVSEGGDFRFTQGFAHGINGVVEHIRLLSLPPAAAEDDGISEDTLNARTT